MSRVFDPSTTEIDEIIAWQITDLEHGLSSQSAAERLVRDGANALRVQQSVAAWRRMLAQFQDPVIYLLLGAIMVALAAWVVEGFAGWPIDAIVIALILVFNAVLGYLQESKANDAVAALSRMTQVQSTVRRDGTLIRIPSVQLVRGDVLLLAEGDAIGADARLATVAALQVNESSLTGESISVSKDAAALKHVVPVADRRNQVFKGTSVTRGSAEAIVVATGMATEMGSIATMLDETPQDATPLQAEVLRISKMLTIVVLVIAAIVCATILLSADIRSGGDITSVLLLGISLAVAAVPEGLPAVLSVVLALGVHRMAQNNAIVKNLSSVETLGSTSVICSDKTGTLTQSEMTAERIVTASGTSQISGVGYVPSGQVLFEGKPLVSGPVCTEHVALLHAGCDASSAQVAQNETGAWEVQGDPTEAALLVAERKLGIHERRDQRFERVALIPFTSERKLMSSIARDHDRNGQLVINTKGAPDTLLELCNRVLVAGETVALTQQRKESFQSDIDKLSGAALRTLAVAFRPLEVNEDPGAQEQLERDLIFIGIVGIIDPPRVGVAQAIDEAQRAGIRVMMITGDHPGTATRIAQDLGIAQAGAPTVTGSQLEASSETELATIVNHTTVFARVAPAQKLNIVDALQVRGNIVAMTGDGVNDAPALKSADIGIAMGITGTDVSKEAAKMILANDNFATIVEAVREGRGIFNNIKKFLRYLLSSNMGEVLTVFLGVVGAGIIGLADSSAVVLPLLATQILWINLITDSGPALAMGIDPQSEDLMNRPPRALDDRIIGSQMWLWVIQIGTVMALTSLLTIDLYLPGGLIDGGQSLDNARTAGFTVLVLSQLVNCFNARSETDSAFIGLFVNKWLWGAVMLSFLLQIAVVHVGFLNLAFGTTPLSIDQWLVCGAMASLVLWFSELKKLFDRSRLNRARSRGETAPTAMA